jgi:uncharacterized protein YjdB
MTKKNFWMRNADGPAVALTIALLGVLLLLGGCDTGTGSSATAGVPATGVSITPATPTVEKDKTVQLKAVISPANATDKTLAWSSATPAVATVHPASGLVTGVEAGTAEITATSPDGPSGKVTVTVTAGQGSGSVAVTGVSINPAAPVTKGDTLRLTAVISPANATSKTLAWSSAHTAVATVHPASGEVYGVEAGTAEITATSSNGVSGSVTVTVKYAAATGVSLMDQGEGSGKNITYLTPKQTLQLFASVIPVNADPGVAWTSDKPAVATVDSAGKVTTVANGDAVITAKSADATQSASYTVHVTDPVDLNSIALTPSALELPRGSSGAITVTYDPAATTQRTITWESSNPAVATVSGNRVRAVGKGEATITAKGKKLDGSDTDAVEVTVTVPPQEINVVFEGFEDEVIDMTGPDAALSLSAEDALNVAAPEGYSDYQWFVDGSAYGSGSRLFKQSAGSWELGNHTLTLVVTAEGSHFSKSLQFTVTY